MHYCRYITFHIFILRIIRRYYVPTVTFKHESKICCQYFLFVTSLAYMIINLRVVLSLFIDYVGHLYNLRSCNWFTFSTLILLPWMKKNNDSIKTILSQVCTKQSASSTFKALRIFGIIPLNRSYWHFQRQFWAWYLVSNITLSCKTLAPIFYTYPFCADISSKLNGAWFLR